MKLSSFIRQIRKEFEFMSINELTIDVGITTKMQINNNSKNRIKFTMQKK